MAASLRGVTSAVCRTCHPAAVVKRLHPALLSLLLLALLPTLGSRPLVRDETTSIEVAQRHWGAFWELLGRLDAPLGLFYLLLRPVVAVSDSAFATRLPSLIGAILAVAILTVTADRHFGRPAAWWTGGVLLANPALWQFASLVRPYSLALATVALTFYVLLVAPQRTVLYGVAAALTVYLQLLFALVLVAQGVLLLRQRRFRLLTALALAAAISLPLAVVASGQTVMTSWIPFTSVSSLRDEANYLFGDTGLLTLLAAALYVLLGVFALRYKESRLLVVLGAAPALVLVVAGLRLHLLGARYLLYVVLALALAAGPTLARVRSPLVLGGTATALALLVVGAAAAEIRVDYRQEDLRSAARYLQGHDVAGDALLYSPDWARPGMEYWLARGAAAGAVGPDDIAVRAGVTPVSTGNLFLPERSTAEIKAELATRNRVWVVGYPGQTWRPTGNTSGDLATALESSWQLRFAVAFGQIELRLLERPVGVNG